MEFENPDGALKMNNKACAILQIDRHRQIQQIRRFDFIDIQRLIITFRLQKLNKFVKIERS